MSFMRTIDGDRLIRSQNRIDSSNELNPVVPGFDTRRIFAQIISSLSIICAALASLFLRIFFLLQLPITLIKLVITFVL